MLGHIAILDDVASAKCLHFPAGDNTLHFTAIPDVQLSLDVHLVTSMVAYGAAPEKVIFVSGNNMVYCCPPRLQFGVPVFQFCDKSVRTLVVLYSCQSCLVLYTGQNVIWLV